MFRAVASPSQNAIVRLGGSLALPKYNPTARQEPRPPKIQSYGSAGASPARNTIPRLGGLQPRHIPAVTRFFARQTGRAASNRPWYDESHSDRSPLSNRSHRLANAVSQVLLWQLVGSATRAWAGGEVWCNFVGADWGECTIFLTKNPRTPIFLGAIGGKFGLKRVRQQQFAGDCDRDGGIGFLSASFPSLWFWRGT